jgi:Ser/Thr protein kinase RdoA (MazF antagonist)
MSLSVLTSDELEALLYWSIGELEKAELPRDGSVNRTVLLETSTGSYALRTCRKTKQVKDLQKECVVIEYIVQQGLPALAPVLLHNGLPYLTLNHQLYILFPKAKGKQRARASLNAKQLRAIGECLAGLTVALADYPTDDIYRRTFQFDIDKTLEKLEHLEKHIEQFPNPGRMKWWH